MRNLIPLTLCLSSLLVHAVPDLRRLEFLFYPQFKSQTIKGKVVQTWQCSAGDTFSLFLKEPLKYTSIQYPKSTVKMEILGNRRFFKVLINARFDITIKYGGKPQDAKNPPWDGGMVWRTDATGKPWLGVSCQGQGSSLWWPAPNDYLDEADSVTFTSVYPSSLFFKGNGKQMADKIKGKTRTTTWQTTLPINLYNITVNIADYAHYSEVLERPDGSKLAIDYYPLTYNLENAQRQFKYTKPMLTCFEKAFGIYPCSNDGFSVVETAYAGMEHQGAIAYGNGYKDGYSGEDYSMIGLPMDFILVHESAHEWWGNSVSARNARDFWLQEALCTYAEMFYVSCIFGEEKALDYIAAKQKMVLNQSSILSGGEGSGSDMYTKGALMFHTLSRFYSNTKVWDDLMYQLADEFRFKELSTEELAAWFVKQTEGLSTAFFYQYLDVASPPILEYSREQTDEGYWLKFRVKNALDQFVLPVRWTSGNETWTTKCTGQWQRIKIGPGDFPEPDAKYSYFKLNR
jgi:aminopeptidase N